MRYSKALIPTLKEDPADAEVVSHKLMVRAGMIRQVARGIYDFLPLGLRVIRKVEQIVRQAARYIGIAVGNFVHLLGPDVIVLGGGLVEAMEDLFIEEVSREAHNFVLPSFKKSFQIVAAKLGDDATVMGAAAWAREVIETNVDR